MPYSEAISRLERDAEILAHNSAVRGRPIKGYPIPTDEDATAYRDVINAIALLKIGGIGGLTSLVSLVRDWGRQRGIIGPNAKATVETQFDKLGEEYEELAEGIEKNDQHLIIDAVGDMTVVLILLSELAGFKFESALLAAYEEIRNRTGVMIDGKFVKSTPDKQD